MSKILFVGLGNMGEPMARNLASEHVLVVSDADEEKATNVARSIEAEVYSTGDLDVDAVILMLPNSRIVEDVLFRIAPCLADGTLIIDMSSSEPGSTIALQEKLRARGIDYVDAPVSGGVVKAESGELSIMCGGTEEAFARAKPILEPLGKSLVHIGGPGSGNVAKVLNNLLSATNLAAAAEVLSVADKFGIAPEAMIEVINHSTGRSQATEIKYPKDILTHSWSSGFAFDLMVKDLKIAERVANNLSVGLSVTGATLVLVQEARQALGNGRDHTELARFIEENNSVNFSRKER
ncbi:NAD(P)-dependent oxidoreductase [Pseudoglutamicibacter cumminsii]|uniref:NAD(P)-dependent oxidoreductase n=1 Tax=Pseudoglutamicibacter cumminsii TaxID=156979 RepID=UPI0025533750|nr:NAD(P)-dependent oxidoreductase [Pseudoglutamicibacter cumminsii]MDK7084028.1 NAD(P)-dependent oxidoreductase [Pseudoglutamicibacter cumminsii]